MRKQLEAPAVATTEAGDIESDKLKMIEQFQGDFSAELTSEHVQDYESTQKRDMG